LIVDALLAPDEHRPAAACCGSLSWADWVTYARRAYGAVTTAKTVRMTVAAAVTHVAASGDMGES
jgi:hypothetical protein